MTSQANFLVTQGLRRLAADCRSACSSIDRAQSIDEVLRLSQISVPALLRGIARTLPELRAVTLRAQLRAQALVDAQIESLGRLPGAVLPRGIASTRREWSRLQALDSRLAYEAFRKLDALQKLRAQT